MFFLTTWDSCCLSHAYHRVCTLLAESLKIEGDSVRRVPSMRLKGTDKIEANNCKVELIKRIFHLCTSHDLAIACMQSYAFKVLTTLVEIALGIALSLYKVHRQNAMKTQFVWFFTLPHPKLTDDLK